ncbi:MAG: hypothetical protein ABII79_05280 [bacterium]
MKKLLVYLVCGVFLVSVGPTGMAVEKKDKKTVKKQVVTKKEPVTVKSVKVPPKGEKKSATLKGKKFDSFIDKNKNGIDDRRESLKAKPTAKTATESKKKDEKKK